MISVFITLTALFLGASDATSNCHEVQQAHLASLHERMNQMLGTLSSSPLLTQGAKSQSLPTSPPTSTPSECSTPKEQSLYNYPPTVVYIPTPASFHGQEALGQPEYPQPWTYEQYYQYYNPPAPTPVPAHMPVPIPAPVPPVNPTPATYPHPPPIYDYSSLHPPQYPGYRPPYPYQTYPFPTYPTFYPPPYYV